MVVLSEYGFRQCIPQGPTRREKPNRFENSWLFL